MRTFILLMLFTAFASVTAQAGVAEDRIHLFANGLHGASASFEQYSIDGNGYRGEVSTGELAIQKPRLFRWSVKSPYVQLIIADGTHIWIYDPDLEQVTVRVQSFEEQSSPLAVLTDPEQLRRDFKVFDDGARGGLNWVVLQPRHTDTAQISRALLGFEGSVLKQMIIEDQLGQKTVVRFSNWKRNPKFAAKTFEFTPPKGVDVVGDLRESAEVIAIPD